MRNPVGVGLFVLFVGAWTVSASTQDRIAENRRILDRLSCDVKMTIYAERLYAQTAFEEISRTLEHDCNIRPVVTVASTNPLLMNIASKGRLTEYLARLSASMDVSFSLDTSGAVTILQVEIRETREKVDFAAHDP